MNQCWSNGTTDITSLSGAATHMRVDVLVDFIGSGSSYSDVFNDILCVLNLQVRKGPA